MPSKAKLDRATFSTSRLLEFCSVKQLTAQTGHGPGDWPLVVIKELVDNSLDACDEHGVQPQIRIRITPRSITVQDNGPGLPAKTIKAILDYTTTTSSREAYVAPQRGAQGNALKTLVAMPFALHGREGRVGITSRGIRHKITFRVDPIQQRPVVDRQQRRLPVRNGTSTTILWPDSACSEMDDAAARILPFAESYAWLNPHLQLEVVTTGNCFDRLSWSPSVGAWPHWNGSEPTSPHWYEREQIERLLAAYIARDKQRPVRDFLAEFRGLAGTVKRAAVLESTGLARSPLAGLLNGHGFNHELVERLLLSMRAETKPVKPAALGIIGKQHIESKFAAAGCEMESFEYRQSKGFTVGGLPWVLEVAFAWHPYLDARHLITGVNWSPGIRDPFQDLKSLLQERYAGPREPVLVFVHLAQPGVRYTDRGKSALALPGVISKAIEDAVSTVTKAWNRQRLAEIRHANREDNRRARLVRSRTYSIKDAAWQVMADAYRLAAGSTGKANARQIMYAARPEILRITGKDKLDDAYFTQTLLPDYIEDHPTETKDWDVVYDARGNFNEPHTDESVALGTLDVRRYLSAVSHHQRPALRLDGFDLPSLPTFPTLGPRDRYGAVLFIEKEGFAPHLKAAQIAERYDLAIMSTKGLSNTAARRLVDSICAEFAIPLLVAHDFDKAGFSIVGTLRRDTRRYTFANEITVHDLGLRLADVERYNLESEPTTRLSSKDRRTLERNGATPDEIAFLGQRRVELNALTSDDFIAWLEAKLTEHGVSKVLPDDNALEIAWRRKQAARYLEEQAGNLMKAARKHATEATVPADLRERVERALKGNPARPWHTAL
jgi:DNA topoisomerase VI subunit B